MTYKFSTFQELLDRVPVEKMQLCMAELAVAFIHAKTAESALRAVMADDGHVFDGPLMGLPDELEWVDDGKGDVGCRVALPDGTPYFDFVNGEVCDDN